MRSRAYNALLKSYPFSEKVNSVSIGAETLYTRLLAQSDDGACYFGHPRMILGQLFPHRMVANQVTDQDIEGWLTELADVGLIELYTVGDKRYVHLVGCFKSTRKDVKPIHRFPGPETPRDGSVTDTGRVRDGCDATKQEQAIEQSHTSDASPRAKPRARRSYSSQFETAWEAYGRRGAKWPAFGQYKAAIERIEASDNPPGDPHAYLLQQIRAFRGAATEAGVAERYIPHLERWLRDDRWESDAATWRRQFAGGHSRGSPAQQPVADVEGAEQTQQALDEIRRRTGGSAG